MLRVLLRHGNTRNLQSSLSRVFRCTETSRRSGLYAAIASSAITAAGRFQSSVADAPASGGSDDLSHITHNLVWGLWNEGNLFSLSTPELHHFLKTIGGVEGIDPQARKSALVRQVEEVMSAEQLGLQQQAAVHPSATHVVVSGYDRVDEALDEADEYGDWGAAPGFDKQRTIDFIELNPRLMGEHYEPLVPRSFQLLHSHVTGDLELKSVNPAKIPGQGKKQRALVATPANTDTANALRFRRALEWCILNAWNLNVQGELNIGAGKVIYYRHIAKQNRNVLPLQALQKHLYAQHPYAWFAIASPSNTPAMESLAQKMGLSLMLDTTKSYKVAIRRMGQVLDAELNENMQCTKLNRPWDRFFVMHYIRLKMPDLRYVVRVRQPIKKRVAEAYIDADILRATRDSVQSVLSPELGEVNYCAERQIRKWGKRTESGVLLQLVETRRTPLIITRIGDEGQRLEYEWIVQLPQKAERVDIAALSQELWRYGNTLAAALEEGMEELMVHSMSSAAAYTV